MSETASIPTSKPPGTTSLFSRLTNMLVSPGYVFDEVARSPHRVFNWVLPIVLVSLASLLLLASATNKQQVSDQIRGLVNNETITSAQAEKMSSTWDRSSVLAVLSTAVTGTFWSALVIWSIGRFLLKSPFSLFKGLEVVGLAGVIVAVGALITAALVGALGDAAARPALSLFASQAPADAPLRLVLDVFNVFHLWTTTVLAIGLSRLSRVSLKEASFWVFGYWVVARIALTVLS
jgi:hypothetical protein